MATEKSIINENSSYDKMIMMMTLYFQEYDLNILRLTQAKFTIFNSILKIISKGWSTHIHCRFQSIYLGKV